MTRLSSGPRLRLPAGALLAGLLLLGSAAALPAQEATPAAYPAPAEVAPVWVSPTPDEAGMITVVVMPGDSLWAIAARAGLGVPQLAALNGLSEQAGLIAGQVLIIGYTTPPAPLPDMTVVETPALETPMLQEPEPTPTDTPPPPTARATQPRPRATLCLSAFDDLDQDSLRDADEPLRAGVAFTVYTDQTVVANYITDGISEPRCFEGLSPGQYYVTRSISPGEQLTTNGNWALALSDGATLRQDFGSVVTSQTPAMAKETQPAANQAAAATPDAPAADSGSSGNWPIAFTLLLGACILILLAWFFRQRQGRSDAQAD